MVLSGALPYTLLLLLLELGVGGALVMHAVHLRGQATLGFVRATTIMAPIVLGLAFWTAFTLEGDIVEGFAIRSGPRDVLVWVLAALTAVSVLAQSGALHESRCLGTQAGMGAERAVAGGARFDGGDPLRFT